jgi:hypothetical protein
MLLKLYPKVQAHIGYERHPRRLGTLTARDIEAFICCSKTRATLFPCQL